MKSSPTTSLCTSLAPTLTLKHLRSCPPLRRQPLLSSQSNSFIQQIPSTRHLYTATTPIKPKSIAPLSNQHFNSWLQELNSRSSSTRVGFSKRPVTTHIGSWTGTMMQTTLKRRECKYGASCFRTNAQHRAEFSHPLSTSPAPSNPGIPSRTSNASKDQSDLEDTDTDSTVNETPVLKPDLVLKDGETVMYGDYKLTRHNMGYYTCTCMAFKTQKVPADVRTCKHLKATFGEAHEAARVVGKVSVLPPAPAKKETKKRKTKADAASDDGEVKVVKKKRATKASEADSDVEMGVAGADDAAKVPATNKKRATKAKTTSSESDSTVDKEDEAAKYSAKNRQKREENKLKAPPLLLAKKLEDAGDLFDPKGWWISEKLDGVRAFWNPSVNAFVSRLGNHYTAPDWFIKDLPKNMSLDGELFVGRGQFSKTVSVVKVDISPNVEIVEQTPCQSYNQMVELLKDIEGKGGEGLMLRQPGSLYEGKRSMSLLKVKTFLDAEAIVVDYVDGKGKYNGFMGALMCKMECGKTFKIGSGFTDLERQNPPALGSIVVYRFQEYTKDGIPRFPIYVGVAADKDKPSDAEPKLKKKKK
ncbi:hypothetical protein HDV05_005261 [Chytridiales sp. JEL 0842]|nr:hypothetical protein HDV05_005261 [Chytridiales sp. JEL 0842]